MKEDNVGISCVKQLVNLDPPLCVCCPLSYIGLCSLHKYSCSAPWATTTLSYLVAYEGKNFLGDVESGRAEECRILGLREYFISRLSKYIVADYVGSLVSIMPPTQTIQKKRKMSTSMNSSQLVEERWTESLVTKRMIRSLTKSWLQRK